MKKLILALCALAPITLAGVWYAGRPVKTSLSGFTSESLTRWQINDENRQKFENFVSIQFDIPKSHTVSIDRQEDFTIYRIFNFNGELLLSMYFGSHPEWPPKTSLFDWRNSTKIGNLKIDLISHWSIRNISKKVWICKSPNGWGVLAWYSHRSKSTAALADKIIESVQLPVKPGS